MPGKEYCNCHEVLELSTACIGHSTKHCSKTRPACRAGFTAQIVLHACFLIRNVTGDVTFKQGFIYSISC